MRSFGAKPIITLRKPEQKTPPIHLTRLFTFFEEECADLGFIDPEAYKDTRVWGDKSRRCALIPQKNLRTRRPNRYPLQSQPS